MAKLEQRGEETFFTFEDMTYKVTQTAGNIAVARGVLCDTYNIEGMEDKFDLGVIRVQSGCQTPRQRVLKGNKTVEGILDGIGTFEVVRLLPAKADLPHAEEKYRVDVGVNPDFATTVHVGDEMQWTADPGVPLTFYELCWPPYTPDRFEDL